MNVLLYVVDSLRADHLSCFGHSRPTTPNLDALAEEGVRYSRCHAPATWTRPVSVSLLTGAYPPAHGVRHRDDALPADLDRLPALLREEGMRTVGVSTMGNVSSTLGYDAGFDDFADLYKEAAIVERRREASTAAQQLEHEDPEAIALPRSADVVERLEGELASTDPDDGLFAFCWSIDPHLPFDPPEGFREYLDPGYDGPIDGSFESLPDEPTPADLDRLRDLYDGEVRYVDDQIGRLVEALEERGVYDDTLLVVLGDHGEAFYEHDVVFHGTVPYEELLHVPLIVKPPAGGPTGETVDDLVSLVDVVPTILDALGIEERPSRSQGRVLPPFGDPGPDDSADGDSSAGETAIDRAVFSETHLRDFEPAHRSVTAGRWKYVRTETPEPGYVLRRLAEERASIPGLKYALATLRDSALAAADGGVTEHLYDLEADPGERSNLASERPAVLDRLRGELEAWLDDCERLRAGAGDAGTADVDAGTAEQLKQLGYTE